MHPRVGCFLEWLVQCGLSQSKSSSKLGTEAGAL
jgi:hypothetical protein